MNAEVMPVFVSVLIIDAALKSLGLMLILKPFKHPLFGNLTKLLLLAACFGILVLLEFGLLPLPNYTGIWRLLWKALAALGLFEIIKRGISANNRLWKIVMEKLSEHQRQSSYLPVSRLAILLPEDYVANLESLYQRLAITQCPSIQIRFTILRAFLEMLWVFYIQIRIENLWLTQFSNKPVDD